MSEYENHTHNISISRSPDNEGHVRIPEIVTETSPLRLKNIFPGDAVYAKGESVRIDKFTRKLLVHQNDFAVGLPTSELEFMRNPAIMPVIAGIGASAINGFLVDYRRIKKPCLVDSGLSEGIDGIEFSKYAGDNDVVFPVGVLMKEDDEITFEGPEELESFAESMIQKVDAYYDSNKDSIRPYYYQVPHFSTRRRPVKPSGDSNGAPRRNQYFTTAEPINFEPTPEEPIVTSQIEHYSDYRD